MFATAPVRGRQGARRTLGGLHFHDYDEAFLFYIFYEQLFRMSIAGERCFGVGSRVMPGIFPTKVPRWILKTFTGQLVDYITSG